MSLYIYNESESIESIAPQFLSNIETGKTEFGELGLYKLLEYIDLDYQGYGHVDVYLDNALISTINIPDTPVRDTKRIYIPIKERKPFNFVRLIFTGPDIYNIECEVTPMEKY